MTSGWGVDAKLNGSGIPTSGTTATDVRKIWGALYLPGIISGCAVVTSGSTMAYTISSGVVSIKTATGEAVLAPVQGTSINTTAAPATGTRTDIIYAQQRFPDIEGDSEVIVGVGTVLPARAIALKRYIISAGQTNTNAAVATGNVDYSIPYGAGLGILHQYQYPFQGILPNALTRIGTKTIYLPTDRLLTYSVDAVLSADLAVGFDNSKYCEYAFLPGIDGGDYVLWATPGLHQAWQSVHFELTIPVSAGTHIIQLGILRKVGPGQARTYWGAQPDGFGRRGIEFTVVDAGPVV